MELVLLLVLVIGAVMFFVGAQAAKAAPPPPPAPELQPASASAPEPADEADAGNLSPSDTRYLVHRNSMVVALDAQVKGVVVTRPAHEALLELTGFDVLTVLEKDGGALMPVTTAFVGEDTEPTDKVFDQFLVRADAELSRLPFAWKKQGGGFFLSAAGDVRAAARLLRPDEFSRLGVPRERLVVMVPDQGTLLAADARDAAALDAMLAEAKKRYDGKDWLSLDPLHWNGQGWALGLPAGCSDGFLDQVVVELNRGRLRDFRDATGEPTFPPARCSGGRSIAVAWREQTTVVSPDFDGVRTWLVLTVGTGEAEHVATLSAARSSVFSAWMLRSGHAVFPVLDARRFPPPAVFEVLEHVSDLDEDDEVFDELVELSLKDTLTAMKGQAAVVLPAFDGGEVDVWLADGRWIRLAPRHEAELIAALTPAVRAWCELLTARRAAADDERWLGQATAAFDEVVRLARDGNHRQSLEKLEALATTQFGDVRELPVELIEIGLGTARAMGDHALVQRWCQRGLAEQPFNREWLAVLVASQVEQAGGGKAAVATSVCETGPRAALMPVLRPPGHTERQHAQFKAAAGTDRLLLQEPLRWPLARGLELELVYDRGASMQPLSMLDAAGSLAKELKAIALGNLAAASGGPLPSRDGAWFADWSDGFAASRLLMDWDEIDWLHDEARPTDVLAFTPLYDSFLVAPTGDLRALDRVVTEVATLIDTPGDAGWRSLLTALPWRFDGAAWVPYEFDAAHPLSARVAKLEAKLVERRAAG